MDTEPLICHACLHADRNLRHIHEKLSKFHYALCETTVDRVNAHYCYECEHLIKKFYNFKQRCSQAMILLNNYNIKVQGTSLDKLHEFLPPSGLGYSNNNKNSAIITEEIHSNDFTPGTSEHRPMIQIPEDIIADYSNITVKFEQEQTTDSDMDSDEIDDDLDEEPFRGFTNDELHTASTYTKIKEIEYNNQYNASNGSLNSDDVDMNSDDNTEGLEACPYEFELTVNKVEINENTNGDIDIEQEQDNTEEVDKNEVNDVLDTIHSNNCFGTTEERLNGVEHRDSINGIVIPEDNKEDSETMISGDVQTASTSEDILGNDNLIPRGVEREMTADTKCETKDINISVDSKKNGALMKSQDQLQSVIKCNDKLNCKTNSDYQMGTVEKDKLFACDYCDYRCNFKYRLVNHSRIHSFEKPFACSDCDYKSVSKSTLVRHLRTHSKVKPFVCDLCGYKCRQKFQLVNHYKMHGNDKSFVCDQCDYKSVYKNQLVHHMRIHTKEKPFACDLCHYRSSHKQHLVVHMRRHTKVKPFACTHCNYRSSQKYTLIIHVRKHTKEKPFACDQCDYKSSSKKLLVIHNRTHTNEKPFACDLCNFKCISKGYLINHIKTHKRKI